MEPNQNIQKQSPQPANLLKKILWQKCFSVNFAKFVRTPFLTEHIRWLLLNIDDDVDDNDDDADDHNTHDDNLKNRNVIGLLPDGTIDGVTGAHLGFSEGRGQTLENRQTNTKRKRN